MRKFFNKKFVGAGIARMRTRRAKEGQPKAGMNRAEQKYAEHLKWCTGVVKWRHEPMSFWLAEGLRYTPDFLVEYEGGVIEIVDVKALWGNGKPGVEDDALAKLKMMGQMYGDWFTVKAVWFDKKENMWMGRHFDCQEREGEGEE